MEKIHSTETMKLLFFTSKPFYPSVDGGCFASEKFLSCLLHANIDVQYVTLSTDKHAFDPSNFPSDLTEKINPKGFYVNTKVRPLKALKSLFTKGSYNCERFFSAEIQDKLIQVIKDESFDGIVFDSLYTLPYLDAVRSSFEGKIVVRTHNVEHLLWEHYASESSGLKKWYLKRLANDLKQFELDKLAKVDAILSISDDDSSEFRKLGIKTKITHIPVNIEASEKMATSPNNRMYHLGMMDWEPNRQAVDQLISWMPELRDRVNGIELHIAGSKSEEFVEKDKQNGIFVHGFVNSVDDFARIHGILVSPILAASGVRIKFLEAMALGIPIITTPMGALGIEQKSCNFLCIANTKEEFIDRIEELALDPSKREEIGQNALNYIVKNHNIDIISQRIVETFHGNS